MTSAIILIIEFPEKISFILLVFIRGNLLSIAK